MKKDKLLIILFVGFVLLFVGAILSVKPLTLAGGILTMLIIAMFQFSPCISEENEEQSEEDETSDDE